MTTPDVQARPILLVTMCGVVARAGSFRIDRKFHVGMVEYARRLGRPFECLMPALSDEDARAAMDLLEVPASELPYRITVISSLDVGPPDLKIVEEAVERASIAYVGHSERLNLVVSDACRARGIPYVAVSEYTLRTELQIMRANTPPGLKRVYRDLRLRLMHRKKLGLVARAAELHANGYPTYLELEPVNKNRVLYFDTRATADSVIPEARLRERLASRRGRPPRLLFSGRYDPIKGALDVVEAGIELHRKNFPFRLDLYGTGPLKERMTARVRESGAGERIVVHDPIPYPQLVQVALEADAFLCCHIQGDPSCTYLETFACGVPIVGYANEMWSPLCRDSKGGDVVPSGDVAGLARAVEGLLADDERLAAAATNARRHALENTMERAWDLRSSRLAAIADAADAARRRRD